MTHTKDIHDDTPVLTIDCLYCNGTIVHGEGRYERREDQRGGFSYSVAYHHDCRAEWIAR